MKKIQTPNILKKVKRPNMSIPKVKGPNIQAPKFLSNLYRDLRDRRLLLPAGLLLVALIVVPLALSSSAATTSTSPPVPEPTGGSKQEAATTPAVLAEQLGVTDYQKRLEQVQSKNPFKRQYLDAPQDTGAASTSSGTTSSDPTVASASGSTSSVSPSTSATASQPPSTTTSGSTSPAAPSEPSEPVLFVFEADLAIGVPGDLSRRRHVELGKFLPSEAKPMVAFAGATEDMKHALFLVSADVSSVTGDGRCVPGEDNCTLLKLKVGDEAKLAYAPESDRVYKLRLMGIGLARADANAADTRNKRGAPLTFAAQTQD
jgi:hypothetical protein